MNARGFVARAMFAPQRTREYHILAGGAKSRSNEQEAEAGGASVSLSAEVLPAQNTLREATPFVACVLHFSL
jgi:hypothetical protein